MGAVTLQSALGNPTLQQQRWEEPSFGNNATPKTTPLNRFISFQASKLTQEQITEYKGVFEMFDEEGNGEVKTQELERLMSLMGINPTKRELSQMAKDVDKNGKGIFNCESFLGLMALYHERTKNQDAELRAAFKVFDKEAKGYIDWNTLKYVLMNAGEPLNEIEAEQMMKEADRDGDGTIDYEEFVAMMTGDLFKMS
ncbi:calglandulin [Acanthochromis polyacanthus]|uniref:calglandulin n=1 Tax=Acanthochromis polyacanthus TaxID=80966 RepID=UPI0022349C0D|nr:calglandulin [Acanthochromis polyacanthus]